ncbi:hypothetical protein FB566_5094 [Stackebrandtia endophytica]|uniref:Uncharacterized protein n=1 Tax=Stackebrandtia endophytica TaxID=1496996 RepID=A0A543B3R9_9ACTN|nr:hypothetical protein [Stackebrandtia endophytica]TQL79486.1 hypothetical protein FB566_5094 [Stackebrandtia endophytica]
MSAVGDNVPDTIRRGGLMLQLIAAVIVVDFVAGLIAAAIIADRATQMLGAEGASVADFMGASMFLQLAFGVALFVLSRKLIPGSNNIRISGIILAALTLVGGGIALLSMFDAAQSYEAITRFTGIDIMPGWVLPVAVVLALAQMVAAALAIVNLLNPKSTAFSTGDTA